MHKQDNFFIFSGGPGSGKTTLLQALSQDGLPHSLEAGRAIIQDQQCIGGQALPWRDRALFAELMLQWELRSYREAMGHEGPMLFDRGMPDVIGYLDLCNLPVADHMISAARQYRYNPTIFLAPPWQKIFHQDNERQQNFQEAERTCASMVKIYRQLDYQIIELPLASVAERVVFVRQHLTRITRQDSQN